MKSGDAMVISVLTFAVCFLLRSLIVQLTCIFLGYKDTNTYLIPVEAITDVYGVNKNVVISFKIWSKGKNIRCLFPKSIEEYVEELKQIFNTK